jgi:hypothetical protein
LDVLPLVALEIHVLLASPLVRVFNHRSRLDLSVAPPFGIGVPYSHSEKSFSKERYSQPSWSPPLLWKCGKFEFADRLQ